MIVTLSGVIAEKLGELVVLEAGGVGYGLLVSVEDHGKLAVGDPAKLYVHEHIRENAHDLFGFISIETKVLFELLLSVNGVGPKMALAILSVGSANDVRNAIASGDTKLIQAATGVGKRVAERVVVDLKDKVGLVGADISGLLQSDESLVKDEAVEALTALGYTPQDAVRALQHIDPGLNTEARVKLALKEAK